MKKKKAIKYFEQEWKGMKDYLKSYLKKENEEDLHQFRVQVKKIKAFLVLCDYGGKQAKLVPHIKLVKKVFKKAGKLRSAHINSKLIQQNIPATGKTAQNFRLLAKKYRKEIKKSYGILKTMIKAVKSTSVQHFYIGRLQNIAGHLLTQSSDEQLHKCRKQIKILLYNYELVKDVLAINLNTAYLTQLQEAIGNWHDQLLSIASPVNNIETAARLQQDQAIQKAAVDELTRNFYYRATGH